MRFKWLIPGAMALLALALAVVLFQGAGLAQSPLADLEVSKTVEPQVVIPGQFAKYTVTLNNTGAVTLEVSSLVDLLPAGFEYVGLTADSEWLKEPTDKTEPEIQWTEPITVLPSSALHISYMVNIPAAIQPSPVPYTNTVTAVYNGSDYQAQAGLLVNDPDPVSLSKTVAPQMVAPEELVTYTLTFANDGYVPVPVTAITDVLPAGVMLDSMTADSDVSSMPSGTSGTVVWSDVYTVPAQTGFVVEYLAAMPVTTETLELENEAWGRLADGTLLGPGSATVEVRTGPAGRYLLPVVANHWGPANFQATVTVDPTSLFSDDPDRLVTYSVLLTNLGTEPGVLANIQDTLPSGFTFQQMAPGSDVAAAPSGTSGQITWTGPFTVAGETSLELIYEVQTSDVTGTYANSVIATVSDGLPMTAPGSASVEVLEPVLLEENFSTPSSHWQPFLNYWRLNPEQWYYMAGGGPDGSRALRHNFAAGVSRPDRGAHDALYMYKEPGSELWTDYVFETDVIINADDGTNRGQVGVWFRGTHQESDTSGLWVTGYYFTIKPYPSKSAILMQLRTDEECADDCDYNYHFSNPMVLQEKENDQLEDLGINLDPGRWYELKVEVQGARIRCYIDDKLVFDYTDNVGTTFLQGTVGFVTYIAYDARFDNVSVTPLR
jgi:uncharacterized repeat protein (TIGR01451 family)